MDLHFLCPYHEHLVLRDRPRAEELWQGLVSHGKIELAQKQWARAASFFGAAAEIALLRASIEKEKQQIASLDKLFYASEFLVDSLCHIGDLDSATAYIRQFETNGERLFSRQPWSRNVNLKDTQVKQRLADAIQKYSRTIALAESDHRVYELTRCEKSAPNTRDLGVSKISVSNRTVTQRENTSASPRAKSNGTYLWPIRFTNGDNWHRTRLSYYK